MSAQGQLLRNDAPRHLTSWRLRWHQYRNKLIASPRFQKWAARNPITRVIANRRATQLHHITAGFVYSQTLSAFVELDIPNLLAEGPVDTARLASATGIPESGLLTLLKAAQDSGFSQEDIRDITITRKGKTIVVWEFLEQEKLRREKEERRRFVPRDRYLSVRDISQEIQSQETRKLDALRQKMIFVGAEEQ